MELQNNTTVKSVAAVEQKLIDMRGFAVRSFIEDHTETGSWAYTVGLRSRDDQPVTLYMRGAVDVAEIEEIMYMLGESAKSKTVGEFWTFSAKPFILRGIVNTSVNESLRLYSRRLITRDWLPKLGREFRTPVEAQDPDTNLFWIWMADAKNLLPPQPGYVDFMQRNPPAQSTGDYVDQMFDE